MKRCVLLLPILALAACGSSQKEAIYVSRSDTGTIPVVSGVSPQQGFTYTEAVMTLPEAAGSITNVRERNFSNGTRQEIILSADKSTHGENVIDVSVATGPSKEGETGELQIGKPSERGVRNEILARFPDVRMGIVTRAMRNAYGPFGLAIGKHSDGARCIFAWQWIDDVRDVSSGQSGFSRFGSLLSRRVSPVSIRIRLCRGDQTVDQMAGLIEGLRLGEASALDRILAMDRRNIESSSSALVVDASKSRGDVAPLPESLEAAISAPAAKPAAVARQSAPRPARVARRRRRKPSRRQRQLSPRRRFRSNRWRSPPCQRGPATSRRLAASRARSPWASRPRISRRRARASIPVCRRKPIAAQARRLRPSPTRRAMAARGVRSLSGRHFFHDALARFDDEEDRHDRADKRDAGEQQVD
jgi:hypothetical protein